MNIWHLIVKEIMFRKTCFFLGLISVIVAIAGLVGAVTLLGAHDMRTVRILQEREEETRQRMHALEDSYRRIMRDMGYNVMIFAGEQDRNLLSARGHPDKTMPYEYVERLARGHIETLNHLLPVLQGRVRWPEHNVEVILSGTPGQVPVYHLTRFLTEDGESYRNPIMAPIPHGQMILGHSVAHELGLKVDDRVEFMEEKFRISRVNHAEGSTADIAVWADYDFAQRALGKENEISIIFALECVCEAEAIGAVEREVQDLLPDVHVMEIASRLRPRAEARKRAEEEHSLAIAAEEQHREEMAREQRMFASVLVPVVIVGAGVWIFFLILGNVRDRKVEIGILRAVGVREATIVSIFLFKAVFMGIIGALLGYIIGTAVGVAWGEVFGEAALGTADMAQLFSFRLLVAAIVLAPLLCAVAALAPALKAAHQDPAIILREE